MLSLHCSLQIYEFDVEKKEYSSWSREISAKIPKHWLKPLRTITNIAYCPDNPNNIMLHTNSTLCVLDKAKVS